LALATGCGSDSAATDLGEVDGSAGHDAAATGDAGQFDAGPVDADPNATGRPTVTGSLPPSPANHNAPTIEGTATAGAAIELYAGSDCSGEPLAVGTAGEDGTFGIEIAVRVRERPPFVAVVSQRSQHAVNHPCVPGAFRLHAGCAIHLAQKRR